jgi:RNA recognition motif-containing protein
MDYAPAATYRERKHTSDEGKILPNSLMVKGSIVPSINDTILFDVFSKLGEVKDVRMIRDKERMNTFRDFAFIEFFSSQDADRIYSES